MAQSASSGLDLTGRKALVTGGAQGLGEGMARALAAVTLAAPRVALYANVAAAPVSEPEAIRAALVEQVTGTVRWRESVAAMAAAGVDPLQHYLTYGWKEGRDPSANFDTKAYLAANPDVAAAGVNPLEHFLQYGAGEGRAVQPGDGAFAIPTAPGVYV